MLGWRKPQAPGLSNSHTGLPPAAGASGDGALGSLADPHWPLSLAWGTSATLWPLGASQSSCAREQAARLWLTQSWSQGVSWEEAEPAEGSGIGAVRPQPMFQSPRGLRPKSEEWGPFPWTLGYSLSVPPRFSFLMLTDVPHICPLYPTGGPAPCTRTHPSSFRHIQGREVSGYSSSSGFCCPRTWTDSSSHISLATTE